MQASQTAAELPTEPGLIDRTRALLPLLRENAIRTEERRCVAEENIAAASLELTPQEFAAIRDGGA